MRQDEEDEEEEEASTLFWLLSIEDSLQGIGMGSWILLIETVKFQTFHVALAQFL